MRTRSRKSFDTSNAAMNYISKRTKQNNINNKVFENVGRSSTVEEKTSSCLQRCFAALSEGIWWRVLPLEDDFDDICVDIGVDWDDLLPFLLHYGLLYTEKRQTFNEYLISSSMWQDFFTRYLLDEKL